MHYQDGSRVKDLFGVAHYSKISVIRHETSENIGKPLVELSTNLEDIIETTGAARAQVRTIQGVRERNLAKKFLLPENESSAPGQRISFMILIIMINNYSNIIIKFILMELYSFSLSKYIK